MWQKPCKRYCACTKYHLQGVRTTRSFASRCSHAKSSRSQPARFHMWEDKMNALEIMKFLQEEIHTTVIATVDEDTFPVTCTIDIMDYDENGLYFLTAKGKSFYQRLKNTGVLSLTGNKGTDTMHCVSVSIRGRVREIGADCIPHLIAKNKYMEEIYPTMRSRSSLTVFQIYAGVGEWFDLSKKPIERYTFVIGQDVVKPDGYFVTEKCISCGKCKSVCPQGCIDFSSGKASIRQENCLHCGNCMNVCPQQAVRKKVAYYASK